jgi:hypothetical protein
LTGHGALNLKSHVVNAEAVGAWKGLEHALSELSPMRTRLCIDSTSVIWGIRGIRGDAPATSQWAFLNIHATMEQHIQLKRSPGHMGIECDEPDALANQGALSDPLDEGRVPPDSQRHTLSVPRAPRRRPRAMVDEGISQALSVVSTVGFRL